MTLIEGRRNEFLSTLNVYEVKPAIHIEEHVLAYLSDIIPVSFLEKQIGLSQETPCDDCGFRATFCFTDLGGAAVYSKGILLLDCSHGKQLS